MDRIIVAMLDDLLTKLPAPPELLTFQEISDEHRHRVALVWFQGRGIHTMDFKGFVPSKFGELRDQICTTLGPKNNCVMQFDF